MEGSFWGRRVIGCEDRLVEIAVCSWGPMGCARVGIGTGIAAAARVEKVWVSVLISGMGLQVHFFPFVGSTFSTSVPVWKVLYIKFACKRSALDEEDVWYHLLVP